MKFDLEEEIALKLILVTPGRDTCQGWESCDWPSSMEDYTEEGRRTKDDCALALIPLLHPLPHTFHLPSTTSTVTMAASRSVWAGDKQFDTLLPPMFNQAFFFFSFFSPPYFKRRALCEWRVLPATRQLTWARRDGWFQSCALINQQ